MKTMIVAVLLSLAACGVEAPAATGAIRTADLAGQPVTRAPRTEGVLPADTGICSTRGPATCAGVAVGTVCSLNPQRQWCLPVNEAPDGSVFCRCMTQTAI